MPTATKEQKVQKIRNAEYYDFQGVQDTLYTQSKENKVFRKLMTIILSEENIMLAYRNIKKNTGSHTPGVDGKTIKDLSKWQEDSLITYIRTRLKHYIPQPVRRVEIPKANGKTRPLGIPTIMDRLIQQCVLQVMEPICEAKFHERNNGFRPCRSAEHAIAQVYKFVQRSGLHFVVDIDIKGFFDNVQHGKLLKQLWQMGIRDKTLLSILSAMLKAEVAEIGFPERGTPQGGIISPLLANVVLNELDWWVSSQWETMPTHHQYAATIAPNGTASRGKTYRALQSTQLKECWIVRYADDFKILCRKRSDAVKLFAATQQWLKAHLGLDISPEKSGMLGPATWCFTRIIPMWVLLAAGTQMVNCSSSTAPADITMWLLPARRALPLSADRNTTQIDEEGRRTSAGPLFEGEAYAKEVDCILHGIAADHAADGFCVCGCTAL